MAWRIRHCVECPKCLTRYLIGFSPYRNGSYLVPVTRGCDSEWTLYCSCGSPSNDSRWSSDELPAYQVSPIAHLRGYGTPDEIYRIRRLERRPQGSLGAMATQGDLHSMHARDLEERCIDRGKSGVRGIPS